MPNEINYYNTNYTFMNPIRHFKANDPYYYEVDNIPIKQLEESNNFLKDQVDGILAQGQEPDAAVEIDRRGFTELKPYAVGNDRILRVKPGRYTSRINNAFTLTPLQVIRQVFGFSTARLDDANVWETETNQGTYVSGILDEFARGTAGNTLNMNGLFERSFVWPIDTEDGESLKDPNLLNVTSTVGYGDSLLPDERPPYPNVIGSLIKHSTNLLSRDLTLLTNLFTPATTFGGQQGKLESEFIKRWRGAIRTSIVDVPSELDITVPPFEASDFFYTDKDGNKIEVEANHRIDLLFIYSKAIDEEATTIPKFNSLGEPDLLIAPTLGLLHGAGLGVSKAEAAGANNETNADDRVGLQTMTGVPLMLAHSGDEGGNTNGFTTSAGPVRGSFPSPDDLLNLAPVLSENLESTSLALIGQTILPLAYIIVEKDDPLVAGDVITDDNIFDIRPFFRTTELAYNERAGIAAATPQVSIANPVVTEAHLEKVKSELFLSLQNTPPVTGTNTPPPPPPVGGASIIAAGVITGGLNYGPEGALCRQRTIAGADLESLRGSVETEFGYFPNSVGMNPMWDKARWQRISGNASHDPTEWINVGDTTFVAHGNPDAYKMPPFNKRAPGTISGHRNDPTYTGNLGNMGWGKRWRYDKVSQTNRFSHGIGNSNMKHNEIFFVSKRIALFNNPNPNYHVNVNFLNCVPLSDMGADHRNPKHAQPAGIWVVKHPNYFIVNVAWPNDGLYSRFLADDQYSYEDIGKPWRSLNAAKEFAGFMLPAFDAASNNNSVEGSISPFTSFDSVVQYDMQDGVESGGEELYAESNGTLGQDPVSNYTAITPILYPSVSFEVIGLPDAIYQRAMGSDGSNLDETDGTSYIDFNTPIV
jgi:hypothetical protein